MVYFLEDSKEELSLAPDFVKDLKSNIPIVCYRYLDLDDESRALAEAYLKQEILGKASLDDAFHIAIGTVNRLDVLVSWNFKHIVNYGKIKLFNSIYLRLGYLIFEIRSPKEFVKYENND